MRISDSDVPEWERDLLEKQTVAGERIGVTWRHVHDDYPVIAPEDIRPGDVVDVIRRVEVDAIDDKYLLTKRGGCLSMDFGGRTFHLVHRPVPDAEAVEALLAAGLTDDANLIESDTSRIARRYLANLRESGWDVVRRAES